MLGLIGAHTAEAEFLLAKFSPKFGSHMKGIPRWNPAWWIMNKFSQILYFMQGNVGHNQIRSDIEEDLLRRICVIQGSRTAAPNSCNYFMLLCVFLRQEMASLSLAGRGWQCGGWMMICWSFDSKQQALVLQGFENLPSKKIVAWKFKWLRYGLFHPDRFL